MLSDLLMVQDQESWRPVENVSHSTSLPYVHLLEKELFLSKGQETQEKPTGILVEHQVFHIVQQSKLSFDWLRIYFNTFESFINSVAEIQLFGY